MKAILILVLFLASCEMKVKEFEAPENLIPKDKMSFILQDIMLMEQQAQAKFPIIDELNEIAKTAGDSILKKHKIDFKTFNASMTYYSSKQDEMLEIYNSIIDRLNRKSNKI